MAAISAAGKLLWIRDPFKDAHLPFYRTDDRPDKAKLDRFVAISFNNSQFGVMRISNGEFLFQGQD